MDMVDPITWLLVFFVLLVAFLAGVAWTTGVWLISKLLAALDGVHRTPPAA
jgi:hypothetical protein